LKTKVGKILSLYITTRDNTHPTQTRLLTLDEKGIVDDKHYNRNIERSILITSIESYRLVQENRIEMHYSALGENILMDYNPYRLPIGTQLHIGNTLLEISQPCTLCHHLGKIDKKLPKLLKENRGIFAKVIQSGSIQKDDSIYLNTP